MTDYLLHRGICPESPSTGSRTPPRVSALGLGEKMLYPHWSVRMSEVRPRKPDQRAPSTKGNMGWFSPETAQSSAVEKCRRRSRRRRRRGRRGERGGRGGGGEGRERKRRGRGGEGRFSLLCLLQVTLSPKTLLCSVSSEGAISHHFGEITLFPFKTGL